MSKSYFKEFQKKYKFLEKYGFVLANDPCNPDRLCYKNSFGEIVLWVDHELGPFPPYKLYIQINGWKTEVDVIGEYKNSISKVTIFKPFEKLVKELFEFRVNKTKEFFGLKVLGNDFKPYPTPIIEPIELDETINPIEMGRDSRTLTFTLIVSLIIPLIILLMFLSFEYLKSYKTAYILKSIMCLLIFIFGIVIVKNCSKHLNTLSKMYLLLYPLCMLFLLNFLPKRVDYIIYFFFFIFSLIYVLIYIIRFKVFKKPGMANGLLTCIYPFCVGIYKVFELNDSIFLIDINVESFLKVGGIASILATILYFILRKDKDDKKEYIGAGFATLFLVFLMVFGVPLLTIQTINYTLDTSDEEQFEYTIIDKETRISSGRYRTNLYYLKVNINGNEEELKVDSYIYHTYEIDDTIELTYHEGYLGYSYYELEEHDGLIGLFK